MSSDFNVALYAYTKTIVPNITFIFHLFSVFISGTDLFIALQVKVFYKEVSGLLYSGLSDSLSSFAHFLCWSDFLKECVKTISRQNDNLYNLFQVILNSFFFYLGKPSKYQNASRISCFLIFIIIATRVCFQAFNRILSYLL